MFFHFARSALAALAFIYTAIPLIVIFRFSEHTPWWLVALNLPAAFLLWMTIQSAASLITRFKNWDDFTDFCTDQAGQKFVRIDFVEFLGLIFPPNSADHMAKRTRLRNSLTRWMDDRVIIMASPRASNRVIGTADIAYAGDQKCWILLRKPYEEWTGFDYFRMIHELGHATFFGVGMQIVARSITLPIFALLIISCLSVSLANLTWWLITISVLLFATLLAGWLLIRYAEYTDELNADFFAFTHCNKSWLGSASPELLANLFLQIPNDSNLSTALRARRTAFVRNISRIRNGEQPTTNDAVPRWTIFGPLIPFVACAAAAIASAWNLGESVSMTPLRTCLLFGASLFLAVGVTILRSALTILERMTTTTIGLGESTTATATKLQQHVTVDFQRDDLSTSGTMFSDNEVDIYTNGEGIHVFHGKAWPGTLSYVEYYDHKKMAVVVLSDGTRLNLGILISPAVMKYFRVVTSINFGRTARGKIIESINVPLKRMS